MEEGQTQDVVTIVGHMGLEHTPVTNATHLVVAINGIRRLGTEWEETMKVVGIDNVGQQ